MIGDPPEVIWAPDCDLPDALTNIGPNGLDIVTTVWGVEDIDDDSVKEWISYDADTGAGNLGDYGLDEGKPYIMTPQGGVCTDWEMCQ